jgi:hypothetical protein
MNRHPAEIAKAELPHSIYPRSLEQEILVSCRHSMYRRRCSRVCTYVEQPTRKVSNMQKQPTYSGYDYGIVDGPGGQKTVTCFPSNSERCIVVRVPQTFYSTKTVPDAHDSILSEATERLNEIVAQAHKRGGGRDLHVLLTEQGPMLAWVTGEVRQVSIDGM